jgi:hypothetical protein
LLPAVGAELEDQVKIVMVGSSPPTQAALNKDFLVNKNDVKAIIDMQRANPRFTVRSKTLINIGNSY